MASKKKRSSRSSRRSRSAHRRSGDFGKAPFAGMYAIEGQFNKVRNWLVGIWLDGVKGISPDRGHAQMSVEKADEGLAKGRTVLAWMEAQRRGPTAEARRYMEDKQDELRRLVKQAEAVRSGAPQKMTSKDYDALSRWLRGEQG